MLDAQTLAFAGVALVLTLTPGADTMLVIRSVLARGRRAGLLTTAGICSGLFIHAVLSGIGLSIILVQSAAAFQIVKLLGACYLVYLGVNSLRSAWRGRGASAELPPAAAGVEKSARWRSFTEGVLTNVLNPKVAVFYLAFLPQFIGPGDPVLAKSFLLASIHACMGMAWLSLVAVLLGRVRAFASSGRVQRWLEAVGGVILVGLGVRLALERR